jgi:D-tyrosyl-tRNA(Tyr) deacylase
MRALIQRVANASVTVENRTVGEISRGLLILVGVEDTDTETDVKYLAGKIANLRIFNDEAGVMNCSVIDIEGEVLVVSQFTLHAQTAKGNRPSYIRSSKKEIAEPMYEALCREISIITGIETQHGEFGADMKVELTNDGPVTIWMDSKEKNY